MPGSSAVARSRPMPLTADDCPFRKFYPASRRLARAAYSTALISRHMHEPVERFRHLDLAGQPRGRFHLEGGIEHLSSSCPFRKRHPEIILDYIRFKFPVLAYKFPVPSRKFPVLLSREFRCKLLNLHACRLSKSDQTGGFNKIPC